MQYCGISDKGRSEIGTTSLQRKLVAVNCPFSEVPPYMQGLASLPLPAHTHTDS